MKLAIIERSLDRVRAAVFPDRCPLCGEVVAYGVSVCEACRKETELLSADRCRSCGYPKKQCGCRAKRTYYDALTAPFFYTGSVRKGITLWKFRGAESSTLFFAQALVKCIRKDFQNVRFDAVTYIPQTETERKARGYNQGEQLAEAVGKALSLETLPLLVKQFDTSRQHELPWYRRSGNVFGVFVCRNKEKISGKNILLVDDIKTSGKTLEECSKMLLLSGAQSVYCAVIALSAPSLNQEKQKEGLSDADPSDRSCL